MRFRRSQSEPSTEYSGAIIAPDLPHCFDAPGRVVANILFEPECAAGRALLERHGASGIATLPAAEVVRLVGPLARAYERDAGDAELARLARQVIAELAQVTPQGGTTDSRVLRAIAHIRDHLDAPLTLTSIAQVVGLSPSRLRHLFVSETGVSCKAFILWERLNLALAMGFGGTSWTEAAHAANFADSAHLSRTCRRMFGLAPTGGHIQDGVQSSRLSAVRQT